MRTALIMTLCLIVALTAFACGPAEEPTSGEGEMAEEHSSEEHETAETESSGNEHEDHGSMTMSSSGSMGGERIHVSMTDQGEMYTMVPEAHSVHAGPVTFVAENEGLIEHELIVVKLLDMNVDLTAVSYTHLTLPTNREV